MNVFHRKRTRNGIVIEAKTYSGRFKLPWMPKPKDINLGTSDKQIAEKRLRQYVRVQELKHEGEPVPENLWGAEKKKITPLLVVYLKSLWAKKLRPTYIQDMEVRINRLAQDCEWEFVSDISPGSFEKWRYSEPKSQRTGKPLSIKTINEHLMAIRSFLNWLVSIEEIEKNSLAHLKKLDGRGKEVKKRRAWTDEELRTFLSMCPGGQLDYRDAVFLLARTGLRKGELQRLTWGHVDLERDNPIYTIPASSSKNKEEVTLPLLPEVADRLKAMRPTDWHPEQPVLPYRIPNATRLKKDVARAGLTWNNGIGDLDFHSLKHTFSTFLSLNQVQGRYIQSLARHKSADMTLNRYTDVSQLPIIEVAQSLPPLYPADGTLKGTQSSDTEIHSKSQVGTDEELTEMANFGSIEYFWRELARQVVDYQRDRMVVGTGFEPVNRLPEQIYSLRALAACISHRFQSEREEAKGLQELCQGKIWRN